MSNKSKRDRLIGQGRLYYAFTDYLKASFKAGLDSYTFRFTDFTPMYPRIYRWNDEGNDQQRDAIQFRNDASFSKRFDDFDISVFAKRR